MSEQSGINSSNADDVIRLARQVDASLSKSKRKRNNNAQRSVSSERTKRCNVSLKKRKSENDIGLSDRTELELGDIVYPYPVNDDDHCETPNEA